MSSNIKVFIGNCTDLPASQVIAKELYERISDVGLGVSAKVEIFDHPKDEHEFSTLEYIQDTVENTDRVLYVHPKGCTNPNDSKRRLHRAFMSKFLVDEWQHCVAALGQFDAVGTSFTDTFWLPPHFAGNFWWANGSYIKTLCRPRNAPDSMHSATSPETHFRNRAEHWILSGKFSALEVQGCIVDGKMRFSSEEQFRNLQLRRNVFRYSNYHFDLQTKK